MTNPLVSVCIPAYNVGKYITSTIESIINQTYKNVEVIIVDDGSTDDTISKIEQASYKINIQFYSQKNKGASAARNFAFKASTGKYVKFLDGDDLINPEMIENQVKLAIENEDCIITGNWGRFYNNDLRTFTLGSYNTLQRMSPVGWLCESWKDGKSMTQAGIFMIPRITIEKAGLWDENLSLIDDLDFFTRVILKCKEVIYSKESILFYRSGNSGSLSTIQSEAAHFSAFRSIEKSVNNLLSVSSDKEAMVACANVWQNFIYTVYPRSPQYISTAENYIRALEGATLQFPCGGVTKVLVSMFGWKLTKKIKLLLNS